MALKANIPDAIDSGGDKQIGIDMIMGDVVPNVLGVGIAAGILALGLGVCSSVRPVLMNVPLVGSLLQSGDSSSVPGNWAGA